MKLKNVLPILFLGLVACSQTDIQEKINLKREFEKRNASEEMSNPDVSYSLAEKVALSTRVGTRAEKRVKDVEIISSEDGEPLIYAVNFVNSTGYVLVSASKNYHPILADVQSGTFNAFNIPDKMNCVIDEYKTPSGVIIKRRKTVHLDIV